MARKRQNPAVRGSQKWIRRVVNEKPELLNSQIRRSFTLSVGEAITWLSPRAEDEYAEYQDQDFLDHLNLELPKVPLADFWPSGGPCWDALGKSETGKVFLVEAKAHISEMLSTGTGARNDSLQKIRVSLDKTKDFLNSRSERDWSSTFYQYTNRLAHLYLLRELNGLPAYLVYVYFLNDEDMNGPKSVDEWSGALSLLKSCLGIGRHRLDKYIGATFIDVGDV